NIKRPLDYILLTGDAGRTNNVTPPAAALAEMALTWMLSYVGGPGPNLAQPEPPSAKDERFKGYTTFNLAKLSLPVSAAADLVGGNLAQQVLAGMLSMRD